MLWQAIRATPSSTTPKSLITRGGVITTGFPEEILAFRNAASTSSKVHVLTLGVSRVTQSVSPPQQGCSRMSMVRHCCPLHSRSYRKHTSEFSPEIHPHWLQKCRQKVSRFGPPSKGFPWVVWLAPNPSGFSLHLGGPPQGLLPS